MFPPGGESPEWDEEGEYTVHKVCVIYNSGKLNLVFTNIVVNFTVLTNRSEFLS